MTKPFRVFDFEIDISGAIVVVAREPLMSRSLSDGEIDAHIKRLKDELDAVAVEMKAAVRKQAAQPLGIGLE
jgi:hypothetical protein